MSLYSTVDYERRNEDRFLQLYCTHLIQTVRPGGSNVLRPLRSMSQHLFIAQQFTLVQDSLFFPKQDIQIADFSSALKAILQKHSRSVREHQFQINLAFLHASGPASRHKLFKDEVLLVSARVSLDNRKLQSAIQHALSIISEANFKKVLLHKNVTAKQKQFVQRVKNSIGGAKAIHVLLVYFGEVRFKFDIDQYCEKYLPTGQTVRVTVFYISRVALLQTFKSISKLPNITQQCRSSYLRSRMRALKSQPGKQFSAGQSSLLLKVVAVSTSILALAGLALFIRKKSS